MSSDNYINVHKQQNYLRSRVCSAGGLISVTGKSSKIIWLLPIVFIVGYLATHSKLEGFELEYLVHTLCCVIACCLLLTRMRSPLHTKAPFLIFLPVFIVAYFIKFYWIVYDPEILTGDWIVLQIYDLAKSPAVILKWFDTISYAFITYCLTSWFLIGTRKYMKKRGPTRNINYSYVTKVLLIFIPSLMFVTSYVMYHYGIGMMGAENQQLPFHIAGWILSIQITLIPGLLLLMIWYSDEKGLKKYFTVGLILLFLHGINGMLMRSSRGFLLQLFIMLMVLFFVTGRINKKRVQMFVVVLLITIIVTPIISFYRIIRAANLSVPISSLLVEAAKDASSNKSESLFEGLMAGSSFMLLTRFSGADNLLHVIGAGSEPLGVSAFTGPMSVPKYYTVEVIGFPDKEHSEAPSALGFFYLIGGTGMVVFGTLFSIVFTWFCWCSFVKLRLLCLPVAQTLFLAWFIIIFIEGTLDQPLVPLLVIGGSIFVCEFILRRNSKSFFLQEKF